MRKERLEALRDEIKEKDGEIVRLLSERAALSIRIGEIKQEEGWDVHDPPREAQVHRHLAEINLGPLPDAAVRDIFREVISACRALQGPTTVAFLGPETSFSHQAALTYFGSGATLLPQSTLSEVFEAVERGGSRWGIVPIENGTEGTVKATLDRLVATPLAIRAEVFQRIRLHLLSRCKGIEDIRRIYSHPQALAQCRGWLRRHLPQAAQIEMESTAAAALKVQEDREGAAVGSPLAAQRFGLNGLAEGIEDNPANTTRFFVMGERRGRGNGMTGRDKTSILFGTPHAPGSLHRALAPFADEGVNLTRIESHPTRDRMWEYLFFADFAGHVDEERTMRCLQELGKRAAFVKILGSYPMGEEGP